MNLEALDAAVFESVCPGKASLISQRHIIDCLSEAVDILGQGKVYSLLVGGLESEEGTIRGIEFLASIGVVPVVNVLHRDPGTAGATYPAPSTDFILSIGSALQDTYSRNHFKPFYDGCGRNSIDSEAYLGLF